MCYNFIAGRITFFDFFVSLWRKSILKRMDIRNKSISVRVSERDLKALDDISKDLRYYSRSDLINVAIKLITHPLFKPFVGKLAQYYPELWRKL